MQGGKVFYFFETERQTCEKTQIQSQREFIFLSSLPSYRHWPDWIGSKLGATIFTHFSHMNVNDSTI